MNHDTELKNINACYPPLHKQCIHDLSFSISPQGVTGLVGESGSGKTTVLRLLAGFMKPCAGSILIDGMEIASEHTWVPPEERRVGVLFQDYALFPHLTVQDNVLFGMSSNMTKKQKIDLLNELLEVCDLKSFNLEKRYPHELSGGQMQRIALARTLAANPRLLVLDEPFSNIDIELRDRVLEHLRTIVTAYKISVVYITHEKNEAFTICDTIAVIRNGKLLQQGSTADVYERPVSSYVAKYFDAANIIPVQFNRDKNTYITAIGSFPSQYFPAPKDNMSICIRPHQLEFCSSKEVQVNIVDVKYLGSYYDVLCCNTNPQFSQSLITIRCNTALPPKKGETVGIKTKEPSMQFHTITM